MFLVTTADERTWPADEKILFLGEWCRLYSKKQVWSKLDHEVLPYHWDDRKQMQRDFYYLNDVYERYLKEISKKLNLLHGTSHELRYWRIIVGPWLRYFGDTIYDRYCSLKTVAGNKEITSSYIMVSEEGSWVPKDFEQFYRYQITDEWNHYIYGHIIKMLGTIPYTMTDFVNLPLQSDDVVDQPSFLKRIFKQTINLYLRLVSKKHCGVTFVANYFSMANLIKLQIALKQIPNLCWGKIEVPDLPVDDKLRDQLKINIAKNEFEKILESLLPLQIPIAYVESFARIKDLSDDYYPKKVNVIYTDNAYSGDEVFKVWSAGKAEAGSKFIIGQHGGNMGTSHIQQSEDHQVAVSDNFYSWGWTNKEKKNIKPLPACKLIDSKKIHPDTKGSILWVSASLPRYSYCIYSVPVGPQYQIYMKNQISFLKNISKPAHELLKVRFDNNDFGWGFEVRLRDNGLLDLQKDSEDSLIRSLKKSRLCVVTHNATVFLETFAANFPTLLFWDPDYYELRSEAQQYFDELRRVKILHDTPESAAATFNEIYKDPLSWWADSERQSVKDVFCEKFANTNENWVNLWKKEILS